MLVVRFRVRCQAAKSDAMIKRMDAVVRAARKLDGVVHFDIGRDITDPNALVATEVFEDRAAMEREEAIPEVAAVIDLIQDGALTEPPAWTIYDVTSAVSPSM